VNASVNVARIIEAMREKGWGVRDTCVNCGVNNKTLSSVLAGKVPKRLDALYRLLDGLEITTQEALINGGSSQKARLYVLSNRWRGKEIA